MTTQARPARVPTVAETRDLALFIRTENPPHGDGIGLVGSKWKKAFTHADALNKSRAGLTTMWHDCTSMIGLGNFFKLDVKELDSSFQPIRVAQKTTAAGSKYLAIKPTQGYRSSTQPRSISHTAGTRVERPHTSGSRKDPRKSTSPGHRRQSPKYIERSDSCLESNKEVVQPASGNHIAKSDRPNKFSFERDRATSSPGTSRPRNSFSTRGWDMFDNGFAGNQTQPLTPDEDIRPHPRSGSVPHNVRAQVSIDQVRPNSSPQDSSRTQAPLNLGTRDTLSPAHARKGPHSTTTTTTIRSGAPVSVTGDFAFVDKSIDYADASSVSHPTTVKAERRYSPKTSGYSTPSGRESTLTDSTGHSSMRQSPVSFSEKQNAPRGTPTNRPRRSGTSRSEKGGRTMSTISSRPRALSAQTGTSARPPDSPMEPVPPIPPPQLEVKQDLLLEALPPLDIPADAVEEMMTKSRENVRKFKMQHLLPDTSSTFHQHIDTNTLSDETSNLSRLERENARLRAILYMYVVDS